MPTVAMPDGTQVSFPDDMPNQQIKGLIASKFPDVVKQAQPAPQSSFLGNVNNALQQRGANLANIADATAKGQQTGAEGLFQGAGQEFGAAGDIAGNAIASGAKTAFQALPQGAQSTLSDAGKSLLQSPVGQLGVKALQAGGENWNAYKNENPRAARNIEAYLNIAPAAISMGMGANIAGEGVNAAKQGANILGQGLEQYGNEIAQNIPTKTLPQEVQSLQPLLNAQGGTLFSKNPNPLESGIRTNQKISEMYHDANLRTKAANSIAREVGNTTPIEAPDVYSKLDRTIASLQGKVAPGTKEGSALDQLTAIRDNLVDKNPIVQSSAGETIKPRTILPGDLMDIEKAINAGLPDNKFLTSGSGQSLSFKRTIQDALGRAAEINPDFGKKYTDYKSEAISLMKTFVDNDSLKPFWQPEDYVAWKTHQNNPNAAPLSDATLSRANKVLDNLNTKDIGKINAVINALPPQEADGIMRDAFVRAKKEQISLSNAIIKTFSGHPLDAAMTAARAIATRSSTPNIQNAINNIKGLRK